MTMTDPVADYLTRLRNAIRAKHKRVDVPASPLKRAMTPSKCGSMPSANMPRVAAACRI